MRPSTVPGPGEFTLLMILCNAYSRSTIPPKTVYPCAAPSALQPNFVLPPWNRVFQFLENHEFIDVLNVPYFIQSGVIHTIVLFRENPCIALNQSFRGDQNEISDL
jgi:hypothetical protein